METSRRGFFAAAAGTCVSIALAGSTLRWHWLVGGPSGPEGTLRRPDGLSRATFEPLLGSRFRLRPESGPIVDAVLSQVDDRPPGPADPPDDGAEAFSLLFTAPSGGPRPAQGTYTIQHPSLGSMQLFAVPVGRARVAQDYEVIVNRRSLTPRPS
jgi:hypothetical protein